MDAWSTFRFETCGWRRTRRARKTGGPSQDIVSLQSFIVGVHHPVVAPPPPAKPTLLQYYCTTIAQYTRPRRPPPSMPYAIQYF